LAKFAFVFLLEERKTFDNIAFAHDFFRARMNSTVKIRILPRPDKHQGLLPLIASTAMAPEPAEVRLDI
jgi:hypothetical protein